MKNKRLSKYPEEIQNWIMVFPNQANPNGNMFGGDLLAIMDTTAAIAAKRFSQTEVSTVTVEAVHFAEPLWVGNNLKTTAKVVAVGNTSMMVKALVYRDVGNGELLKCVSAFFNLVAFDENRKPTQVPNLIIEESNFEENRQAIKIIESAKQREKDLCD
ncbi:MAG: acyl-CoA thioesterase [Gammaproteobacteria bacterium]|nr:MAG: acyl-CoA thioesterase [Gammaproteobacteria bacterium]